MNLISSLFTPLASVYDNVNPSLVSYHPVLESGSILIVKGCPTGVQSVVISAAFNSTVLLVPVDKLNAPPILSLIVTLVPALNLIIDCAILFNALPTAEASAL